jgi:hypothetical protein
MNYESIRNLIYPILEYLNQNAFILNEYLEITKFNYKSIQEYL